MDLLNEFVENEATEHQPAFVQDLTWRDIMFQLSAVTTGLLFISGLVFLALYFTTPGKNHCHLSPDKSKHKTEIQSEQKYRN